MAPFFLWGVRFAHLPFCADADDRICAVRVYRGSVDAQHRALCGRRSLACRNAERRWAFQRVWLAAFFRLKPITCALGAFSYELTGAYDASGRQAMPVRLWRYIWNCRKELWFPARACCFRPPRKLPLVIQKMEEMSKFCFSVGQRPNQLIVQNSKTPNTLWFPCGRDPTRDGLDWKKNNKLWYALRYKQGSTGAGKNITTLFLLLMLSLFVPWFPQFCWHQAP